MAIGRHIAVLTLSDDEHDRLERWARRPTTAQAWAQCARIVLACARGRTNTRVARELRLTKQTAGKRRSRFVQAGSTDCGMNPVPARHDVSATLRIRCDWGAAGLLTDQNRVVGLPRDPRYRSPATQIAALLKRPDARDMPVVADASRALLSRAPGARGPMRLGIDGDPWWTDMEHRGDQGRSEQNVHSPFGWLVPLRPPTGQTCEP